MRTIGRLAVVLGAVAVLAAPAAQGFGGGRGGDPGLMTHETVRKELKVDDEQAKKLDKVAERLRAKAQESFQALQDVPQEERFAKMRELGRSLHADAKKELADILKPEQCKRYEQIYLQQQGANALADPDVQAKLKLTDAQKDKVREITEDSRTKVREIIQNNQGDQNAIREKMTALRKETQDKAMALLTSEQKATWKELTGDPVEIRFGPPR